MTEKTIAQIDLDKLLDRLRAAGQVVYAPAKDEAGDVTLTEAPDAESVVLEYRNFRLSPKAFFLPQDQTLLTFRDGRTEEPSHPDPETFLFGVRPCDAAALLALDAVFLDGEQHDPYYARLRASTTVVETGRLLFSIWFR